MAVIGDEDGGESDEKSEIWDDAQMMQVDGQLADVFRQQANTSKRSDLKRERFLPSVQAWR